MEITDIQNLSNEELRQLLVTNGVSVGPVIGTTRKVYEKKLYSILAGGDATASTQNGSPAAIVPEAAQSIPSPSPAFNRNGHEASPVVRRSVTPLVEQRAGTPVLAENVRSSPVPKIITEAVEEEDYCGEESFRYIPDSYVSKAQPEQKPNTASVFGAFAVLVALIAFVAVFYFEKESKEFVTPYVELGKQWTNKAVEYVKQAKENFAQAPSNSEDVI